MRIGKTNATSVGGTVGTDTKPVKIVNGIATAVTNELVDVANAQDITGIKTIVTSSDNAVLKMKNTDATATTPSANKFNVIQYLDSSGTEQGRIDFYHSTTGEKVIRQQIVGQDSTTSNMLLRKLANGDAFVTAPYRSSPSTTGEVLTQDNGVTLSTNQTISSQKILTGAIPFKYILNRNITDVTSDTAYHYADYLAKDNSRIGVIGSKLLTNSSGVSTVYRGVYLQGGNQCGIDVMTNGSSGYVGLWGQRAYNASNTNDVVTIGMMTWNNVSSKPAFVNNGTSTAVTPSNASSNGFYYVTSGTNSVSGADSNPFLQYHTSNNDFRILTTAHSANWMQQIGTDFRTNHVYVRRKDNGTWRDWVKLALSSEVPTNTNQLTNGAGFITSSGSCNYATSSGSAPTNGWTRVWQGAKTGTGTETVTSMQNKKEIMVVASPTGTGNWNGMASTILSTTGLTPSTTSYFTYNQWNMISVPTTDGTSNAYYLNIRINSWTQIQITENANATLRAIYVR